MPEPALQATALRYAARDLSAPEAAAFEALLAEDQDARDALAEAVRLSAAALCEAAPRPGAAFRARLRERLNWGPRRGLLWAAAGAVCACALFALSLADRAAPPLPPAPVAVAAPTGPAWAPREPDVSSRMAESSVGDGTSVCGSEDGRSVAEIWAELSTPEQVEKARDDEHRLRQKMQSLAHPAAVWSDSP